MMKVSTMTTFPLFLAIAVSFPVMTEAQGIGVLVLAHGGSTSWNNSVLETMKPLNEQYPLEVAFGMADPKTMQAGIDKLEARGVTRIVVVPLFVSSFSPIMRQIEYLLRIRNKLADKPMVMDHSTQGGGAGHEGHSLVSTMKRDKPIELKPLDFQLKVVLARPLDENPLVAEILFERIHELSQEPGNETVIIVAHGPNDEEDNKGWIKTMENIADQIRLKQKEKGSKFKQVFSLTVRDDADKGIYEQAKEQLRTLVYQSSKDGDVLVVPLLLAQGGVDEGITKRLDGLKYKWSGRTLLPHNNITKFIQTSVENGMK